MDARSPPICAEAPEVFIACCQCGGEGYQLRSIWVYERGCGFGHDDVESVICDDCNGSGGYIREAESDCHGKARSETEHGA